MRALAALLSAFFVARLASAADAAPSPREKVRVTYSAPPGCPESAAFLSEVRARVGSDWEAAPDELARTIDVTISRRGDRQVGGRRPLGGLPDRHLARIEFLDARGHRITRAVSGQRCDEVMKGIALITALAIQARVEEALSESEPVEVPTEPSSPPGEEKPQTPAAAAPPPTPERAPREPADDALFIDVGARFGLAGGIGPDVALGPGGFVGFGKGQALLQLGLDALFTGEVGAAGGRAVFRLIVGRIEFCPLAAPAKRVTLRPCAFGEGGVLRGEGVEDSSRVARAIPQGAPWIAPGLALRVEVEVDPVVLALEGSGRVPIFRPTFFFDNPEQTVHEVWPIVPGAAASVGLRFR